MKKKILIVEDEKAMARALELKFQKEGFEAKAVYNGEEGVEEMEKGDYDLALLDLIMPKMNGFQVLEEVKKKGIKTKIIVATNLSQEEDRIKAQELGAVGYLVKSDTPIIEIIEMVKGKL